MTKWEYTWKWIDVHMSPVLTMARWGCAVPGQKRPIATEQGVMDLINAEYGEKGWELVHIINGSDSSGTITRAVLFFKRPMPDESEAG